MTPATTVRFRRALTAVDLSNPLLAGATACGGGGGGTQREGQCAAEGVAGWVPERGEAVELPGGRTTGLRGPSMKEGIFINPG
ncbi:hypothetical protein, partial [Streptomyces sp. H036]|uniref:hypothetical protein n=1 Tax=Streptomyces sp. H036 TaxID=1519487 RepID=UPI001F22263A